MLSEANGSEPNATDWLLQPHGGNDFIDSVAQADALTPELLEILERGIMEMKAKRPIVKKPSLAYCPGLTSCGTFSGGPGACPNLTSCGSYT